MSFKKVDRVEMDVTVGGKVKIVVEDFAGVEVELDILSYEFGGNGNSVVFFTDNPLYEQIQGKARVMPFRRRLLNEIDGGMQLNLEVMIKMDENIYKEILPELDFKGAMTVGYSLNNP